MADTQQVIKLVIAAVIVVIILRMLTCRRSGGMYTEPFADYDPQMMETMETVPPTQQPTMAPGARLVSVSPTGAPMAQSVDLLPKPQKATGDFGEFAPKNLGDANFVDSKKMIGLDTIGNSLRNASYDLRQSPVISKQDIGPWSQSTIDADLYRKNIF